MKQALHVGLALALLAPMPSLAAGDAADGQAKAAVCAACHGIDGNSPVPTWPKIAGQHEAYLERQVSLIRSGDRLVPEMAAIAAGLSDQDIADLAAYFATQAAIPGVTDRSLLVTGERLYRAGNPETDVPACMACHGPAGEGNPLSGYPAVAGQHAAYTEKMLKGFRAGTTWGEDDAGSKVMTQVANRLTDDEIRAVASYMQGLHPVKETTR